MIYTEITPAIETAIILQYGSWVRDYHCLQRGNGCCLLAAMDGDTVTGFAAIHPARWTPPLEQYEDAFIEVIEVAEDYRRKGIGSRLVTLLEQRAKDLGYYQIRAWSSEDKTEALKMWRKLRYGMCPAVELGSIKPGFENAVIRGYYYAKVL